MRASTNSSRSRRHAPVPAATVDERSLQHLRHTPLRRGAVIRSCLTLVCAAGVLLTAAMVLDPATLQARSTIVPPRPVARTIHHEFVNALGQVIGDCEQVLAVRPHDPQSGAELLLWLHDRADRGVINTDELAIIRHNPLLATITMYVVADRLAPDHPRSTPNTATPRAAAAADATASAPRSVAVITSADLASPGFSERWRAMPSVRARILASGLADMTIESLHDLGEQRLSLLRLHLTWSDDLADHPHEASTIIPAGRRPFSPLAGRSLSARRSQESSP